MASSKLLEFLIRTANEPDLIQGLRQKASPADLVSTLQSEHGLTPVQAKAVASGDFDTISSEIGKELVSDLSSPGDHRKPCMPPVVLLVCENVTFWASTDFEPDE